MTFERTGRENSEQNPHPSQSIHHANYALETAEDAYVEFGQWMDEELARFEECYVPVGGRPQGFGR